MPYPSSHRIVALCKVLSLRENLITSELNHLALDLNLRDVKICPFFFELIHFCACSDRVASPLFHVVLILERRSQAGFLLQCLSSISILRVFPPNSILHFHVQQIPVTVVLGGSVLNPILILSQSPGNPHGQTLLAMVQRVPFGSHAIVIHVTARGRNLTSPRPPSLFTSASNDRIEKTKHTPGTECCSVNV